MKEIALKMNLLAHFFDAKKGTKTSQRCRGKWAGTTDYFVKFDNGKEFFISNGMERFEKSLDFYIGVYDGFRSMKLEIIKALAEMAKEDNRNAEDKGLSPYKIVDVDYVKSNSDYLGWFYVTIEVNGQITTVMETNLHYSIKNAIVEKDTNPIKNEMWSGYRLAGGIETPEFIWHGYGWNTKAYNAAC